MKILLSALIVLLTVGGAIGGEVTPYSKKIQKAFQGAAPDNIVIKCLEGENQFGKEMQCSARIKGLFTNKEAHDLQTFALAMARTWREHNIQIDLSVTAMVYEDTPIARFIYNHQFDHITPIYMWF